MIGDGKRTNKNWVTSALNEFVKIAKREYNEDPVFAASFFGGLSLGGAAGLCAHLLLAGKATGAAAAGLGKGLIITTAVSALIGAAGGVAAASTYRAIKHRNRPNSKVITHELVKNLKRLDNVDKPFVDDCMKKIGEMFQALDDGNYKYRILDNGSKEMAEKDVNKVMKMYETSKQKVEKYCVN